MYFIEFDNVTSITEAQGVVTAMTLATTTQFRKYQVPKETSFLTQTINSSVPNGTLFYQQELTVVLNKMQANSRNEILLLAQNRLMAIALDNNGKYWLVGRTNAIDLTGGDSSTGTAHGDRNGTTLTFTGMEAELAPEVDSTIIAGLLAPAV